MKKIFGHDYVIEYDCISNHDVYAYLRVRLEVPRGQDTKTIVILNGKEIGEIIINRQDIKQPTYSAYRYMYANNRSMGHLIKSDFIELGRAIAAIITDMVR